MRRVFTEPTKPEELYKFFTYGLPLTPLNWRSHWWPGNIRNTLKRRFWRVEVVWHSESVMVEYRPGNEYSDYSWYMYERKYLANVHK